MTEETELTKKREELKRQLADGEYKTLIDLLLDRTGYVIQKLTRSPEPPSYWYSAGVVVLFTYLIAVWARVLFGETYETMPPVEGNPLLGFLLPGLVIASSLIAVKLATVIFFTTLRNHLVDAIESIRDLADIQRWLSSSFCNVKTQLLLSLVFGALLGLYAAISVSMIIGGFVGLGTTIGYVPATILLCMALIQSLRFFPLAVRLGRYQFRLYAADPSSSEVIDHLSDMLTSTVYVFAISAAIVTLVSALLGLLTLANIIVLVLLVWGPLTIFFATSQIALSKIITRAKWKTLNGVQAKVESLQSPENLVDQETMEAVNRLMNYHDRIKATRNSALDLRAGLNFLNSLLLPLLAFVLANLDKVLGLLLGKPESTP